MGIALEIRKAVCGYGAKPVVKDISLKLNSNEILCILGPNGVGKTTLFKTILGFLKLQGGEILLNGENIQKRPRKRLAKAIGYVPQAHTPPFPFNVMDVVMMGRNAHLGMFASPTKLDREITEEAIETLKISFLKDKIYTEISDGERKLVLIARDLAQQPAILVMDEPTANLDYGNQIRGLEQINRLSQKGLEVIMTSHFPDHAFLCSSKVALMQRNNVFLIGGNARMKNLTKIITLFLISLLILVGCGTANQESTTTNNTQPKTITITDQMDKKVEIPTNIQRIADSWPAHNVVLDMLGSGDKIVATILAPQTRPWFYKINPAMNKAQTLFKSDSVNTEELIKTKPDIVFMPTTDKNSAKVESLGIPVGHLTFKDFEGLKQTFKTTGDILGGEAKQKATNYVSYLDSKMKMITDVTSVIPKEFSGRLNY